MKLALLSLVAAVVLFQTGCASRPSIDDQASAAQQEQQREKSSDAFAHSLGQ